MKNKQTKRNTHINICAAVRLTVSERLSYLKNNINVLSGDICVRLKGMGCLIGIHLAVKRRVDIWKQLKEERKKI